jgi:hypothetical protein
MAEGESNSRRPGPVLFIAVVLAVILSVFLPLLCAGVEFLFFGSNHAENFFRRVGIHEALSRIYLPILRLFR